MDDTVDEKIWNHLGEKIIDDDNRENEKKNAAYI